MENYCTQCTTPIPDSSVLCTQCLELVPDHFYCDTCGKKCFKSQGEYGNIPVGLPEDSDIEYTCNECLELASEETYYEALMNDQHEDLGLNEDW